MFYCRLYNTFIYVLCFHGRSLVILMYGPEGRILNFNTAWCKVVQSQVSILKHANKIYNEHKNIMFLLNTTYTKILIYIEKVKKMFGPGPTGPYGSYAYGFLSFVS